MLWSFGFNSRRRRVRNVRAVSSLLTFKSVITFYVKYLSMPNRCWLHFYVLGHFILNASAIIQNGAWQAKGQANEAKHWFANVVNDYKSCRRRSARIIGRSRQYSGSPRMPMLRGVPGNKSSDVQWTITGGNDAVTHAPWAAPCCFTRDIQFTHSRAILRSPFLRRYLSLIAFS